jgi:hypothetical protein
VTIRGVVSSITRWLRPARQIELAWEKRKFRDRTAVADTVADILARQYWQRLDEENCSIFRVPSSFRTIFFFHPYLSARSPRVEIHDDGRLILEAAPAALSNLSIGLFYTFIFFSYCLELPLS